jgi:AraC-like DNA-binding protein
MELQDVYFSNLNGICHTGGHFSIDCGDVWQIPPSRFAQHKFYYILDGRCTIRINGQDYAGIPGRWFFIPAGTLHGYANDSTQPFSKYWMHFDLMPHDKDLFSAINLPYYIDIAPNGPVDNLFEVFSKIAKSSNLIDKLQTKSLLFSLLSEYIYLSSTETVHVSRERDPQSEQLLSYIRTHLQEELPNTVLASYVHMDGRSFIRYFKKLTGYPPAKYITLRRMELAKNLLEESDLSISDIMYRSGFNDLSYFSKLFKKHYSLSPRTYRDIIRHEP